MRMRPEGTGSDKAAQDKPPVEELVEVICPFTKPTGGAQRFGSWNNARRKRFNDLVTLIKKNQKDRVKCLTRVETEALN